MEEKKETDIITGNGKGEATRLSLIFCGAKLIFGLVFAFLGNFLYSAWGI